MTRLFDVATLERQRNRWAVDWHSKTELPQTVEQELLERLSVVTLQAQSILVLGAVGLSTLNALCDRYVKARITVIDCAESMLSLLEGSVNVKNRARIEFMYSSLHEYQFSGAPFDLVFSNLYLPWFDDLGNVFAQLHRHMSPNGCLHFSCLGPDSFAELRQAWAESDALSLYHTLTPPDMHDVGDALVHAGFREPVMDRDNYVFTYSSTAALLDDLRAHGVCNGFAERRKGLTGRQIWSHFLKNLAKEQNQARLNLTIELVIGQAWRGDGMSQQRYPDGATGISLEALAHQIRKTQGQ